MTVGGNHHVREEVKVTGENDIQTLSDQSTGWLTLCLLVTQNLCSKG